MRVNDVTGMDMAYGFDDWVTGAIHMNLYEGVLGFGINSYVQSTHSHNATIDVGTWYWISVVWDGSTATLYFDGDAKYLSTYTASSQSFATSKLGSWSDSSRYSYSQYSEFRLWSVARDGAFECLSEPEENLVVWYKMYSLGR